MQVLFMWTLLLFAAGSSSAQNVTDDDSSGDRSGRQVNFGVFNVVTFPNDACGGSNNLNGTCYTAAECTSKGGSGSGSCASGFGVCCVFSLACGGSASENNTYAIMSSYDTSSDADPCLYNICKVSSNICKLRIDFDSFTIATQTAMTTSTDPAAAVISGNFAGKCETDFLTITNPGGNVPPKICGINTGQHMFLDASDACNEIKIDIDTGTSTTRKWQLKVTQFTCESMDIPFENCLQWHTGTTGTFFAFGWDTSVTTITQTTHNHLQDQNYDICFRRERGYCSLCFTPQIYNQGSAPMTSYGVSGSHSIAGESSTDSHCGLSAAITLNPAGVDYIEIYNLQPSIGTTATAGVMKICGLVWNSIDATAHAAAAAAYTSCTWSTPFKWGVRFDGREIAVHNSAAILQQTNENYAGTAGAGTGNTGFYMAWWQNVC